MRESSSVWRAILSGIWRPESNLVLILFIFIAALSFSCRAKTDVEIIAAVIDDMAARMEKKDTTGLVAHLTEDYRDFEGRDRLQTTAMVEEYFTRYRGIKIKLLASRVTLGAAGSAVAETDVALYSGLASALRKAVGFSSDNYRLSCLFRKEDEWRVSEARWEYIQLDGLFPESLKILKELFPDL
jgi:ketosteroid isomerase-like protein